MVLFVGLLALISGCAQVPLHSNLTNTEMHQKIDENFTPGMTRVDVIRKLDELHVPGKNRIWYDQPEWEGGAPPQLLVRLYPPGGFWLDEEDQILSYADAVFVFRREGQAGDEKYERTEIFRHTQRYHGGEPVNIPATPTKYPWGYYPTPPPPPRDPPVGGGGERN